MPKSITEESFPAFKKLLKDIFNLALSKTIESVNDNDYEVLSNLMFDALSTKIVKPTIKEFVEASRKDNYQLINPRYSSLKILVLFLDYCLEKKFLGKTENKSDEFYWYEYLKYYKRSLENEELVYTNQNNSDKDKSHNNTFKESISLKPKDAHSAFQFSNYRFKHWAIVILIVAFFGVMTPVYLSFKNRSFILIENFSNISEDTLFSKGWFLIDKDSAYWNKRNLKAKSLTLYTLVGDYWIRNRDSSRRLIKNNLIYHLPHKLSNFEAEVEIDDFFPDKCCQQAGFIFLKDTSDLANNFRYTVSKNSNDSIDPIHVNFVYSETNGVKNKLGFTGNLVQNQDDYIIGNPFKNDSTPGIEKIWLNVIKQGNQLTFRTKIYRDDRDYKVTQTYTTVYEPTFICLAAFQAYPHEFNNYHEVPVIPVSFKNFMIKSISSNQ